MKGKEIINTNQFIWMLFCIITAFTTLQAPRLLIVQARRDSYLSVILAWYLDVLLAIVYAYMGVRFPGQNMVQYSITIFGKKIGKLVGVIFPIFFLIVSALLQRGFSIILFNAFFPKTPEEVILISSYIVVAYAALKGIETIGRVCEILGPIYLFSFIILFLFVIPDVNMDRLKPQLELGVKPFITGAPYILAFIGICIMMGMFIPICDHPENGFLAKFRAVSMGASVICLLIITCIGVFSFTQAKDMVNVSLELARVIHIGGFLERVEAIWLIIAVGATILTTTIMIWAFSLGISQAAGLKSYRSLVIPTVLLSFILSRNSFKNSMDLVTFSFYSYPFLAIIVETGLEMLLFFSALILKKKG